MQSRFKKWRIPIMEVVRKHRHAVFWQFGKLLSFAAIRNIRWAWVKAASGRISQIQVFDNTMFVDISKIGLDIGEESVEKQLVLDRAREAEATKIFRSVLKPGHVVLDIGANVGYYALQAAKLVGSKGMVYALEPSPNSVELLKRSIKANQLRDIVEVHEKAIGSKDGTTKFLMSDWSNLSTTYDSKLVSGKQIPFSHAIDVEAVTVDNFLKGRRSPDLIKMDIEGAEVEIIKGMQQTLRLDKSMVLFIEIHPQLLDDTGKMQNLLRTLQENGFKTVAQISHDDYYRKVAQITRVEHIPIADFIMDERVVKGTTAFEAFFAKGKG